MTLPREVSLRRYPEGIRLRQAPLREARKLRGEHLSLRDVSVEEAASEIRERNFDADTLEIEVEIELGGAAEAGLSVRANGQGQRTLIGYSPALGHLFVDRAASGATDFHDDFSGRHAARLAAPEGKVKLHVFVDRSSVEVFGGDGRATITERIFPDPTESRLVAVRERRRCAGCAPRRLEAAQRLAAPLRTHPAGQKSRSMREAPRAGGQGRLLSGLERLVPVRRLPPPAGDFEQRDPRGHGNVERRDVSEQRDAHQEVAALGRFAAQPRGLAPRTKAQRPS